MALNDIYAATLLSTVQGHNVANVLHVKQTSADDTHPPEEAVAGGLNELWNSNMANVLSPATVLRAIQVKCIKPTPRQTTAYAFTTPGLGASDAIPPGAAVCFSMYAGAADRRHRGRIYIAGLDRGFVKDTNVTPAAVTYIEAWFAAFAGTWSWSSDAATFSGGLYSLADAAFRATPYGSLNTNIRALRGRRVKTV